MINSLPPDALALLREALTSHDFMFDHNHNLASLGEKTIECAEYRFELIDGRDRLINFADPAFSGFSKVEREAEEAEEAPELFFENEEPDPSK